MDAASTQLLAVLAEEGTHSAAKVAKRLGLAQSQLFRQIATLPPGLVVVERGESRTVLRLSEQGLRSA